LELSGFSDAGRAAALGVHVGTTKSGRSISQGADGVLASSSWITATGAEYSAGLGRVGYAPLTHYTVEYREWGEGPPLVLVPGLAGGYGLLGPVARLLARHYRVISYQLRGEGDCFALRRPFGLTDLVDDLAEFLDWHFLESPIVFGVSFGGVLALEFAARNPHRLQNLVLQSVGARFERNLLHRVAGTVLADYPLPTDSPFVNQFFNLLFGGKNTSRSLSHFVTRQCWQTDQSVMAHRFRLVENFDITRRLRRIQVPSLILSGDRDLLVSPASLEALHQGIADSRLVQLAGAGHLGFVTQPERVAQEVHSFLAECQIADCSLPN
jgi:pimeloyl-ACP methyl ester carboxylesterase